MIGFRISSNSLFRSVLNLISDFSQWISDLSIFHFLYFEAKLLDVQGFEIVLFSTGLTP